MVIETSSSLSAGNVTKSVEFLSFRAKKRHLDVAVFCACLMRFNTSHTNKRLISYSACAKLKMIRSFQGRYFILLQMLMLNFALKTTSRTTCISRWISSSMSMSGGRDFAKNL